MMHLSTSFPTPVINMRNILNGSIFAMLFAVAACDVAAPTASDAPLSTPSYSSGSGSRIEFIVADPRAGQVSTETAAFWAVQGEDRSIDLNYVSANGGNTSRRLLRFRVRQKTQMIRPNGTLVAKGDSILITVRLADATHLVADFQPSGMRFTGRELATLTMSYAGANHDFNHDGVINSADLAIERSLSIFRQESSSEPWLRVSGIISEDLDQITSDIAGFTNYVIAY